MQAYKMWKTFDVSERVDILFSRARREEIERHNEEVRQNREMLRTLPEAVLNLAKQELPFRGHGWLKIMSIHSIRSLFDSFSSC